MYSHIKHIHLISALPQKQVEKFCQLYMFDVKYKLPRSRYQDLILSRHLLVDDHSNTLFCFVPKVGCTNLKLALFYAQGLLTKEDLDKARDDIDQDKLEECIVTRSFLSAIEEVFEVHSVLPSTGEIT